VTHEVVVKMQGIRKVFARVVANNNVDLEIRRGEVHGLIGENGAGKSTLMNILYGLHQPDEGSIEVDGNPVEIKSPLDAIKLGIGMVHQHFMLVRSMTVLENIILGNTPTKGGFIDKAKAKQKIEKIMDMYGLKIDLDSRVYQISVGQMQRVEIIKAIYRGAKVLILDEPTAVLTPLEIDELFVVIKEMAKQGCSIVFITHKLKEVMAVTDNITVMRRGVVTGFVKAEDTNTRQLASMMVGRDVVFQVEKTEATPENVVLELVNVNAINDRGLKCLKDVNIEIRKGEIVGIAGVEGNGQTELIEVITGMRPFQDGRIRLVGKDIKSLSIRERRDLGISHIPEDRLVIGVSKDCSVEENLIVLRYRDRDISINNFMQRKTIEDYCWNLIDRFDIKVASGKDPITFLSGGNMQKVIIARELDANPTLLVAGQPTRGVDVGAIEFIHTQLIAMRDEGVGILLVSSEIDEILSLSDRIYVLYEGEIAGNLVNENINEVELGLIMTGSIQKVAGTSP